MYFIVTDQWKRCTQLWFHFTSGWAPLLPEVSASAPWWRRKAERLRSCVFSYLHCSFCVVIFSVSSWLIQGRMRVRNNMAGRVHWPGVFLRMFLCFLSALEASSVFVCLFVCFPYFGCPMAIGVPGPYPESNLSCSFHLHCSCGNARSLTHCAGLEIEPSYCHCRDAADPIVPQQELLISVLRETGLSELLVSSFTYRRCNSLTCTDSESPRPPEHHGFTGLCSRGLTLCVRRCIVNSTHPALTSSAHTCA